MKAIWAGLCALAVLSVGSMFCGALIVLVIGVAKHIVGAL